MAEICYPNACQSCSSGVYLIFEVFFLGKGIYGTAGTFLSRSTCEYLIFEAFLTNLAHFCLCLVRKKCCRSYLTYLTRGNRICICICNPHSDPAPGHRSCIWNGFKIQTRDGKVSHRYHEIPPSKWESHPKGPTIEKIQSRSKFSISIEIFNLARNFQSRRLDFPTKNRAAVGGALENFILARNFQSGSEKKGSFGKGVFSEKSIF